ncbi:hypothetical protein [uncultured Campylobacter sp.]|uniref:hypothetical protein n=1 Tax=uncultured Campylobacter sp. TaxID=218934 RepID=UPI00262A2C1D|nr:hypothetical protein [uncultured Campylobacter sp.]
MISSARPALKFLGFGYAGKRKILNFKLHKILKFKLREISKFQNFKISKFQISRSFSSIHKF